MDLRAVVWDALNTPETRVSQHGRCVIGGNEKIRSLRRYGEAVLPAIEKVVCVDVPERLAMLVGEYRTLYMGMVGELLVEYFRSAIRENYIPAGRFVRELDGAVLREAVLALNVVWQRDMSIPAWLRDSLREVVPVGPETKRLLRRMVAG